MEQKYKFDKTANFIFEQTANRIKSRKDELNITLYQIAGFENQKAYNDADNFEKEIDINILSKIMNNNRSDKKTNYLLPSKYQAPLTKNLNFKDIHELLWGSDTEIQSYVDKFFVKLYEDGLVSDNLKIKNTFRDLLECYPDSSLNRKINHIYDIIKENFFEEFDGFTKAKNYKKFLYEIVGTDKSLNLFDTKKSKNLDGTILNEYLGFKKLNDAIEEFTENRIVPIILNELINQLAQQ